MEQWSFLSNVEPDVFEPSSEEVQAHFALYLRAAHV